ncbi:MAG: DUF1836 domain-containing protein [Clostridiales Family XIII bacterium]|jgi:DNA-binding transcriptional MerR regulator|nr:DUF1836 domain-containing protein [Clostridiales Family XIII bacterium]
MARFEEYLSVLAGDFTGKNVIEPDEFPQLALYADQVAEFFSSRLDLDDKKPAITKNMISDYVKKGLIPPPDKKRFDRDHIIMIWFILFLKMAYRPKDVEAVMKPFVENIESRFDEKFNFTELYEKLGPVFTAQSRESADRALATVDTVKEAIRETGVDDDDSIELFLVLTSIAIQADTAMSIGRNLLREFFAPEEK